MLTTECRDELRSSWLPHLTDSGLNRLIELLQQGSPLLIHGCFSRAVPMGCLATHAAWHHPETAHLNIEAGIRWLYHVAGLNPATSHVLREWDRGGCHNWQFREDLLDAFLDERRQRETPNTRHRPQALLV